MHSGRRDFVGIPQTPAGLDPSLQYFVNGLRENIELLAGQRGAVSNHAVVKGDMEAVGYPSLTGDNDTDIRTLWETLNLLITALKT